MKKLLSIAIVISLCFTGCGKNGKPVSRSTILFDTSITITIYDGNEEDLDSAFSLCRKYEQLFSRTIPDSEISRLNGGDISVIPSEETMDILKTAGDYSLMSKGAFDVTICPVSSLWNFKEMPFKKPTDEMIKNSLKSVDYHNVLVENGKVTLKNNAKIDLGAIAKGYATDKVAQLLINRGIQSAIINFGGNVLLIGEKQNGGDFKVGITKPFSENHGEISATVETTNRSVVTSGIYERYYKDETSF
ncbi:MAG: FAD:protein FMN transferase, partial [Oscillospiraceae bacterium]